MLFDVSVACKVSSGEAKKLKLGNLVMLTPLDFYPFVGVLMKAWFKALGTARGLHRQVRYHSL
jgi:hypothetical protein